MTHRFSVLIALAITVSSSALLARQDSTDSQVPRQPTLTVVTFDADRSAKLSQGERDAAADELATRLVESGCYRVLEREWLPVPRDARGPLPLSTLRAAAASAGVEYLVLGSVSRSLTTSVRPRPAGMALAVVGAMAGKATPFFLRPFVHPPVASREALVSLNVRVIDVSSGVLVRTTRAQGASSASKLMPPVLAPGLLLRGPAGAAVAVSALAAKASRLDTGLQHAIADAAQALARSAVQLR
jgi:curli biogenesis system outer membrane secretion channel CsgG